MLRCSHARGDELATVPRHGRTKVKFPRPWDEHAGADRGQSVSSVPTPGDELSRDLIGMIEGVPHARGDAPVNDLFIVPLRLWDELAAIALSGKFDAVFPRLGRNRRDPADPLPPSVFPARGMNRCAPTCSPANPGAPHARADEPAVQRLGRAWAGKVPPRPNTH